MGSKSDYIGRMQAAALQLLHDLSVVNALIEEYNDLGSTGAFAGGTSIPTARGDPFTGDQFVDGVAAMQAVAASIDANSVNLRRIAG